FEITTATAFLLFAEHPADAVLLEVGLGGRLDATNVVARPRLTILTPIAIDHAEQLGNTLDLIAAEKAGILKRGAPAVVAPQDEDALFTLERIAHQVGAPLIVAGRDYDALEQRARLVFQTADILLDLPRPALVGRHQFVNAGVAVAAALQLPELGLTETAI